MHDRAVKVGDQVINARHVTQDPVWADRLYLDASVNMQSNRVVPLELSFSPFAGKGTTKVTNVRFAMDEGRFSGFMRLKFDTAATG